MNTFFKLVLASVLVLAVIFTVGLRSFHFGSDDRGRVYFSIEEVHNNAKAVSNAISARYKAPDGGWWMPFEMYEAI
ncbi:MAG: hypothetical protein Q8P95_04170, partial [bacterium]|nr:hypothetical protein [bacterium]